MRYSTWRHVLDVLYRPTVITFFLSRRLRPIIVALAAAFVMVVHPSFVHADNESILIGYGFGLFNPHQDILGRTEGGYYDFIQFNFAMEHRLIEKRLTLLFEPFIAYINRPEKGMDVGCSLALRYWATTNDFQGLYLTLGTGVAYTTVEFKEQGVHGMFILQGGIGYKWSRFFVEDRFRHYSNAGLSSPNRSLNANMINIGLSF